MSERELNENKEWYMDAVESCLILRGMTRSKANAMIQKYQLKERLDAFPEIQLHYDIDATADEVIECCV